MAKSFRYVVLSLSFGGQKARTRPTTERRDFPVFFPVNGEHLQGELLPERQHIGSHTDGSTGAVSAFALEARARALFWRGASGAKACAGAAAGKSRAVKPDTCG